MKWNVGKVFKWEWKEIHQCRDLEVAWVLCLICVISPYYHCFHQAVYNIYIYMYMYMYIYIHIYIYICCIICYHKTVREFKVCSRVLGAQFSSDIHFLSWAVKGSDHRTWRDHLSRVWSWGMERQSIKDKEAEFCPWPDANLERNSDSFCQKSNTVRNRRISKWPSSQP